MKKAKNTQINLTNDSLTNIHIMTPLLDDKGREAIGLIMYGCYIGEELARKKEEIKKTGRRVKNVDVKK